ncbi:hypothetical protein EYF80_001919 [Liparis tanakae]|uniref:Uncharacterized protein n=1 Tax=Liparis tanakae TaxID=230148 RepID=A0A4Z2JCB7_9TELE|nr:hypothetical protein EYF80_001919 [Liparis tanakae]
MRSSSRSLAGALSGTPRRQPAQGSDVWTHTTPTITRVSVACLVLVAFLAEVGLLAWVHQSSWMKWSQTPRCTCFQVLIRCSQPVAQVLVPLDQVLVPLDQVLVPLDQVLVPLDQLLAPLDQVLVPHDQVRFPEVESHPLSVDPVGHSHQALPVGHHQLLPGVFPAASTEVGSRPSEDRSMKVSSQNYCLIFQQS